MKIVNLAGLLLAAMVIVAVPAHAQSDPTLDALLQRLEQLDQRNTELRDEVQALRQELERLKQASSTGSTTAERLDALDEQMNLQAGRLSEQDLVKAQSSQRVPVRLSGALLFSLFRNSRHGVLAGVDYPVSARADAGPPGWAGTLRRSVIGLEFQTPQALLSGEFRGSLFVDLTEAGDALSNIQPRLRTAAIEGRWNRFAIVAGQEKPIFSVRDPTSLAQVQFAPLTGAGHFWLYRPQVRVEQGIPLGPRGEFRARIGVSQAPETGGAIPPESRPTLETRRPALEGHVQFGYETDAGRRFEIGSGFHRSTTHVLRTSVPADLISLDWFVKPIRWAELTGAVFTGQNMSKGGSAGAAQGHALITVSPGVFRPVPVSRRGGWAQVTVLPTSRLTVNLHGGVDNPGDANLMPTSLTKNTALVVNFFYRLAPNVLWGFELGQVRTDLKGGQRPRFNHHDVHLTYLF